MATTAAHAACRNHPARPALGICVRCRTRVCSECTTKVEGINYCVTCLGQLVDADARARVELPARGPAADIASAVAHLALLVLALWGLLEVALPGYGG